MTAEITATRREELRQTFRKLPGLPRRADPTMARLGELTDQQIPLLADAQRAAPSLDTFLSLLGPFANASRPAIKSLGKTSVTRHQGVPAGQGGGGRAATGGGPRAGGGQAAAPVPADDRRQPPGDRRRPARQGRRPAGQRPLQRRPAQTAASPAWRTSGTTSSGRAGAQRVRQRRPRPAPGRDHLRVLPDGEPHAADQSRAQDQVRPLQHLPGAQPARHHHPGLHPRRPARPPRPRRPTSRPPRPASGAPPASPTPARCPARPTSPSPRSSCPPAIKQLLTSCPS